MMRLVRERWERLKVQHKIWAVLGLLLGPLFVAVSLHLYLTEQLLLVQQQRHGILVTSEHVHVLRRLAVDIEDAFRGYVLTEQPAFLAPMQDAQSKLEALQRTQFKTVPEALRPLIPKINSLLESKRELIADIQEGRSGKALAYIRSGKGLELSDALRHEFRTIEDELDRELIQVNEQAEGLSGWSFKGLWAGMTGILVLGWICSRLLARSITDPINRLQSATTAFGRHADHQDMQRLLPERDHRGDELAQLALAYVEMARRIGNHIRELEILEAIGQEINAIGPDGLAGVLRKITDRAVESVGADVCLVMLKNEIMGCWVVAAASGEWNERLENAVMLWEEFPVSVQAFETRQYATGRHLRSDRRPEVSRRNVIGDSMLSIPLLAQGEPFGVLVLLSESDRSANEWNRRLAVGMAQSAALAISNAHLYEAARQKHQDLLARLRYLEHLAEALAHDLKGPGERMGTLAQLLLKEHRHQLDEKAKKWLAMIEWNSREMTERVEGILAVAKLGAHHVPVVAVDPSAVLADILKSRAEEIERSAARIEVARDLPLVACHNAYLRQVFDNLLSNALKFAKPRQNPHIRIEGVVDGQRVCFTVADNGIGIPREQRDRVFQPFVRLRSSDAPGSGIGLSIVRRIVELYEGKIWIEETEQAACAIKFTLPWFAEEGRFFSGPPGAPGRSIPSHVPARGGL